MATRNKTRLIRMALTYEDLHKLIGLKGDAEILGVDSSYNRLTVTVQHNSVRAGSVPVQRSLSRCRDLFKPKERPKGPDLAALRAALRIALTNDGDILLQDGVEAFVNKFGMILVSHGVVSDPDLDTDLDEEEDDDDD